MKSSVRDTVYETYTALAKTKEWLDNRRAAISVHYNMAESSVPFSVQGSVLFSF